MRKHSLAFLGFCLLLGTGCAKPLLLKKFAPVVAPQNPSQVSGKSVYVEPFKDENDPDGDWEESEALDDPDGYEYVELSDDQEETWTAERDSRAEGADESTFYKVGWQRNVFGIPIRDVMSLNNPADWLTESAKVELQGQGATIVDSAAQADVIVKGALKHIRIDLYMTTWCHLVVDVDVDIEPRGGAPLNTRIHTAAQQVAWNGSDEESFDVLRKCEQKYGWYVVTEINRALGGGGAPTS